MIYVLGDSHSRSFSKNGNFFPLFVGAGKENCFISDEVATNLKAGLSKILSNLPNASDVLLVLGEPDTRFYLGKGWTPWLENTQDNTDRPNKKIYNSFLRYSALLKTLRTSFKHRFYILSVIPSVRPVQNKYVAIFNSYLREFCKTNNFEFIDIEGLLLLDSSELNPIYIGDEVHLNNLIQPLVENIFINNKVLSCSYYSDQVNFDGAEVHGDFVFNEKFSCFVYAPKFKNRGFKSIFSMEVFKRFYKWLKRMCYEN